MHEINLLPPPRRQSLRRTTLLITVNKFLASVLLGASLLTVAGAATIGGFWVLSYIAAGSTKAEFQLTLQQYRTAQEQVSKQTTFLTYIETMGQNRLLWSTVLKDFFNAVPAGVTISSISGKAGSGSSPDAKPTGEILFGGQAVARSTLTVFADRLKLVPGVTSVEAPNANLIERDNPQYTFKLVIGDTAATPPASGAPINPTLPNGPTP